MAISWATKRRAIYLTSIFGFIFLVAGFLIFYLFYAPPTCFDGKHNGSESGVDCGGSCSLRCDFEIVEPVVLWNRIFEVSPGFYSAAAYVRNPNLDFHTPEISYIFRIYGNSGEILAERQGTTFIPAGKTFVVFEPGINIIDVVPERVAFEFTGNASWFTKDSQEPEIFVSRRRASRLDTRPRIDATLENRSIYSIPELEVSAIMYDGSGNALGVSRTLQSLERGESAQAVFTWPRPFDVEENICAVPVDVMLVMDRSGSMVFDNWDLENPEPMESAKEAALAFVESVHSDIALGLVSFATEASVDNQISAEQKELKDAISNIKIQANTVDEVWLEETNISHGLSLALEEIEKSGREDTQKFIILFTDGVPTHPKHVKAGPDYPFTSAEEVSQSIMEEGIEVYSIGLGEERIDKDFLTRISSSSGHHFSTSDVGNLVEIFEMVATDICRNEASVIEIITRVIP